MGFKIKTLGAPFRPFAAAIGPDNLTAGVPIAELYFGLNGTLCGAATLLQSILDTMDEIIVTRRGETIIDIDNGQDLVALTLAPWNDHIPRFTTGGSSNQFIYAKGLTLPLNIPVGASGEFQIQVYYLAGAAGLLVTPEYISIAEGQGYFDANEFGMTPLLKDNHFHIVKRLFTPTATGWNNGVDIGAEGWLVGLMIFQTHPEATATAKTAIDLHQIELMIGGEEVIRADCLTAPGRQGARSTGQSDVTLTTEQNALDKIYTFYYYFDFAKQPWDCRGKSVVLRTDAGATGALRIYPIYLVKS